jgi:hypothetical protein
VKFPLLSVTAYAVENSTFSNFVNEPPSPSSQYATAMDIVMAMATMMIVAMTGLTALMLRLNDFIFVFFPPILNYGYDRGQTNLNIVT